MSREIAQGPHHPRAGHIRGWRHGRGFGEKDLVPREDKTAGAFVITSAEPGRLPPEPQGLPYQAESESAGILHCSEFFALIISQRRSHPRAIRQIRHGPVEDSAHRYTNRTGNHSREVFRPTCP